MSIDPKQVAVPGPKSKQKAGKAQSSITSFFNY
jgi:hypothetical protein